MVKVSRERAHRDLLHHCGPRTDAGLRPLRPSLGVHGAFVQASRIRTGLRAEPRNVLIYAPVGSTASWNWGRLVMGKKSQVVGFEVLSLHS